MKNLLTQDPPDYGLWTRDKSFFFQTIPIVLADWADEPNKLWGIYGTFGFTFAKLILSL
jgi:hypothetical protein